MTFGPCVLYRRQSTSRDPSDVIGEISVVNTQQIMYHYSQIYWLRLQFMEFLDRPVWCLSLLEYTSTLRECYFS